MDRRACGPLTEDRRASDAGREDSRAETATPQAE